MPHSGSPSGPLSGITVLDLTRVLAGPYCTMMLLDLGAEVIKVESPAGGDDARAFGPFIKERSAYFMSLNRGKRSIALDLKAPEDRAIFERLLEKADVLVENFRAGTMEKLGYGWDVLQPRHPRLIYAATSGFGHTGPYADRPAYDMVVQGMGGIMSLTGHKGGPPTRVGSSIGDITAGLFTTIGITSALYDRTLSGKGVKVDVAMLDCQLAILENAIVRYFTTGEIPGPMGARHPSITPFEAYAAQDGYLTLAAGNDKLFHLALEAIGLQELITDPRFMTGPNRTKNVEALKQIFETALAKGTVAHWLTQLQARGVPSGPINNVAQIVADPQIKVRNMVVSAQDDVAGTLHMAGNPIKLSAFADPPTRGAPPVLNGNRADILAELNNPELRLVRAKQADAGEIAQFAVKHGGAQKMPGKGAAQDVTALPGFLMRQADGLYGLASFSIADDRCHLVCLLSPQEKRGCGSALLQAVISFARSEGCRALWVLAGNDNLRALDFFQKRNFRITGLLPGALAQWHADYPAAASLNARIAPQDLLQLELLL